MSSSGCYALLLRGINLGPNRRIPMAALRDLFSGAGYKGVRTYVQSGNVVLSGGESPAAAARHAETLIAGEFGFDVNVVVRTREELAKVLAHDPLGDVATEPKRYQVTFLESPLSDQVSDELLSLQVDPERIVIHGRELYTWHPEGVARSKLWARTAGKGLGVVATARNWTTVTKLLEMCDEG